MCVCVCVCVYVRVCIEHCLNVIDETYNTEGVRIVPNQTDSCEHNFESQLHSKSLFIIEAAI